MIFWHDLRYGFRSITKNAGSSAAIILVLAVGIGASCALYSIIDGAWIHQNAFKFRGQWVALHAKFPKRDLTSWFFSAPEFFDIQRLTHVFAGVAALHHVDRNLGQGESAERVSVTEATANIFGLTNNPPLLGRTFGPDEDRPGGEKVAVISYRLWKNHFQSAGDIIGRVIKMDDQSYTVIGVMPPRYLLWGSDIWVPIGLSAAETDRSIRRYWISAVLRPKISLDQATQDLQRFADRTAAEHSATNPEYTGYRIWAEDVREAVIGPLKRALFVLISVVALVVLMTCANVTNLLLARASSRTREIATRLALGATRGRIVRQLLTESLPLAAIAGSLGFLLAVWGVPVLMSLIPPTFIAEEAEIKVNYSVLLFALSTSLMMALIFGLSPALQSSRPNFSETLKGSGRGQSSDRSVRMVRDLLVIGEVGLAVVILSSTGLIVQSYVQLNNVHVGFESHHLATMRVSLPDTRYPTSGTAIRFYHDLLTNISSLPGIQAMAAVSTRVTWERPDARDFVPEGRSLDGSIPNAACRVITPGYFKAMGIPVLSGRVFTEQDNDRSLRVAVISKTMAKNHWPGVNPVGQRFRLGAVNSEAASVIESAADQPITIVGVVDDVVQGRTIDLPIRSEFYLPLEQHSRPHITWLCSYAPTRIRV
jgi:putative ABC transport system permease protein